MSHRVSKKRPCCICRRWFRPHPRVGDRQRTCGRDECQRKLHRRNCKDWHDRNQDYDRETRLRARLKRGKEKGPYLEPAQGLNWEVARDEIGLEPLVVIDEFAQVAHNMARDEMPAQRFEYKGKSRGLILGKPRDEMDSDWEHE